MSPGEVARALDAAWVAGRHDELAGLLHPDMVILGPDLQPVASGRTACASSYRAFRDSVDLQEFQVTDAHEHVTDEGTAVVSCTYRIAYETDGVPSRHIGRDVLVLTRAGEDGDWQVVWRLALPGVTG